MNRRKLLFSLAFCMTLICGNLFAQQRSLESAMQIANEFLTTQTSVAGEGAMRIASRTHASEALKLAYVSQDSASATPYFYVINKGESGYVIVSGDERAYEVLGYSDAGSFDFENMPANMKEYLSQYAAEIKSLDQPISSSASVKTVNGLPEAKLSASRASSDLKKSVAPLLGTTQWDQGAPYNIKCPMSGNKQTVTGCVATAIAQIMYYHKWPEQGRGSNAYVSESINKYLSVDFSKSIYDWDNMTPQYSSASSTAEKDAVSHLMYDCGVAVNMLYDIPANGGSATYDIDALKALPTYFNYDTDIRLVSKTTYTNAEWSNIIKNELSANRPIYHGGDCEIGGHAFVCDGYTEDDFFHFNWGWGGYQDGYYRLYSLNPAIGGIGGGSVDGFNQNRSIIIGIQKPDSVDHKTEYALNLLGHIQSPDSLLNKGDSVSVTVFKLANEGCRFDGEVGLVLLDEDSTIIAGQSYILEDFGYTNYCPKISAKIHIPTTISDGNYRIYTIYKADDMEEWKIVRSYPSRAHYINVVVAGNAVSITEGESYEPQLELIELGSDVLYSNREGSISLKIKNNDDNYEYASEIIVSLECGGEQQQFKFPALTILAGETFETEIVGLINDFNVPADGELNATLKVFYDKSNIGKDATELLGSRAVVIQAIPSSVDNLELSPMQIYPNPAQDQINIVGVDVRQVTICDVTGRSQMTSNEALLHISQLNPGSYLVYVLDKEGKLRVEKLIKQ